jgi:hypothetical protein
MSYLGSMGCHCPAVASTFRKVEVREGNGQYPAIGTSPAIGAVKDGSTDIL